MRKTLMMLVAGLVLAGCGGGTEKAATTTAPPTTKPTPTTGPQTSALIAQCERAQAVAVNSSENLVNLWRSTAGGKQTLAGANAGEVAGLKSFIGQIEGFIDTMRAACHDFTSDCPDPAGRYAEWLKGTYRSMLDTTSPTTVDPGPAPPINCA